jgi:hypothetical protein
MATSFYLSISRPSSVSREVIIDNLKDRLVESKNNLEILIYVESIRYILSRYACESDKGELFLFCVKRVGGENVHPPAHHLIGDISKSYIRLDTNRFYIN